MTRTGRITLAVAALLLVATGAWASPYWGHLSPTAYAIVRVHWTVFVEWLWLFAAAGGIAGAAVLYRILRRNGNSPFFRNNDPMFRLFRFFWFLLAAAVIGVALFFILAIAGIYVLDPVMWIYSKVSGDYSYYSPARIFAPMPIPVGAGP